MCAKRYEEVYAQQQRDGIDRLPLIDGYMRRSDFAPIFSDVILPGLEEAFANKKDFEQLSKKVDWMAGDVAGLKKDVAGLKKEVSQLKIEVAGLKQDVTQLKVDVSQLKSDMEFVKSSLSMLSSGMATMLDLLRSSPILFPARG